MTHDLENGCEKARPWCSLVSESLSKIGPPAPHTDQKNSSRPLSDSSPSPQRFFVTIISPTEIQAFGYTASGIIVNKLLGRRIGELVGIRGGVRERRVTREFAIVAVWVRRETLAASQIVALLSCLPPPVSCSLLHLVFSSFGLVLPRPKRHAPEFDPGHTKTLIRPAPSAVSRSPPST